MLILILSSSLLVFYTLWLHVPGLYCVWHQWEDGCIIISRLATSQPGRAQRQKPLVFFCFSPLVCLKSVWCFRAREELQMKGKMEEKKEGERGAFVKRVSSDVNTNTSCPHAIHKQASHTSGAELVLLVALVVKSWGHWVLRVPASPPASRQEIKRDGLRWLRVPPCQSPEPLRMCERGRVNADNLASGCAKQASVWEQDPHKHTGPDQTRPQHSQGGGCMIPRHTTKSGGSRWSIS